jgi:hypothetical protein
VPALPIVSRHDPPVAITTHDEWQKHGGPAAKDHWVRRSAWELACDWIKRDAADRVVELLTLRPELAGLTLTEGVAEKQGTSTSSAAARAITTYSSAPPLTSDVSRSASRQSRRVVR